jgi:serine/threonine-protein kinase
MGEVYLSRDASGLVALKRVLPRLRSDPGLRLLFVVEAKLLRRLKHPSIPRALDVSRAEEGLFTMEYVEGWTLAQMVRTSAATGVRIPTGAAIGIVRAVANALHAVHEAYGKDGFPLELVHADISPTNVLVTPQGDVRLIDFGIARGRHRPFHPCDTTLGTLGYMSPEQIRGEPLTRASDIFSLGVLLWELTTHQRLFRAENVKDAARRIARCDVPPPSDVRWRYDFDLEDIVLRTLRPIPELRYPNAILLDAALERFAYRKGLRATRTAFAQWLTKLKP